MTRTQELKMLQEYLEKHGATTLPPDKRIEFNSCPISPWKRSSSSKRKKGKRGKK